MCQCGCGQPVDVKPVHFPTVPRYIHGHNAKVKPPKPLKPRPPQCPCECGCGELAASGSRFVSGHNRRGQQHTTDVRSRIGAANTGERNGQFGKPSPIRPNCDGVTITRKGYRALWVPQHPFAQSRGYVHEHRLVIEDHLRQTDPGSEYLVAVDGVLYLSRDYVVHHVDCDKLNNDVSNLEVMTPQEHTEMHRMLRAAAA